MTKTLGGGDNKATTQHVEIDMEKEISDMVARKTQAAKNKREYPNGAGKWSITNKIIGRYFANKKPMTPKQKKARARAKRARRG